MSFDPQTLLLVGGILCWILAIAIEFQSVRPAGQPGLADAWTIGLISRGLGLVLISQKGASPDLWTTLASVCLLAGPLLYYAALQRVRGVPTNRMLIAAVPLGVGIALPLIGFSAELVAARTAVFACALLFGLSLTCWSAVQIARTGYVAGASVIVVSSVALGFAAVAGAFEATNVGISGALNAGIVLTTVYLINDVCIALSTFGYMDILRTVRDQRPRANPDLLPDTVTGLYSAPAFLRSARSALANARLRGNPVSLMLIQADGLDPTATHAQGVGNQRLKWIAQTIRKNMRTIDFAGRVSDQTIGVLMPEMSIADGITAAERIRTAVTLEPETGYGTRLQLTVSMGLCPADTGHADLESAIALAAACLHRARQAGGNRIATPLG